MQSYVTSISKPEKRKVVVTIDETERFSLYQSELKLYGIYEGAAFTEEQRYQIFHELLPERIRQRVLYMLEAKDYSEADLHEKLLQSYYPEALIAPVLEKMKILGYLDDRRYVSQYIAGRKHRKSIRMICQELKMHGISDELMEEVIGELQEDTQTSKEIMELQRTLIRKEFEKKQYDFSREDEKLKNKIISSLLRKGFSMEEISEIYREMKEER